MTTETRWQQRFQNFQRALLQLSNAVELSKVRSLTELEAQGLIQAFEFTHELAWNTIKDFLISRGAARLYGSKDSTREAFKAGIIQNGEIWMQMIESRNQTSHTYDIETAEKISSAILHKYFFELVALREWFSNELAQP